MYIYIYYISRTGEVGDPSEEASEVRDPHPVGELSDSDSGPCSSSSGRSFSRMTSSSDARLIPLEDAKEPVAGIAMGARSEALLDSVFARFVASLYIYIYIYIVSGSKAKGQGSGR